MNSQSLIIGVFFITALYHFSLYIFYRENKTSLVFSLINIFAMIFNLIKLYPMPYQHKIFIIIFLTNPLLFLTFNYLLFPQELNRKIPKFVLAYTLILSILVITAPSSFLNSNRIIIMRFISSNIWTLTAYIIYGLIKAVIRKREDALMFLAAFVSIGVISAINTAFKDELPKISNVFGSLFMISTYSFILAKKYSDAYHRFDKLLKKRTKELESKNHHLEKALEEIKVLKGLLPICSHCKKIKDDKGYWHEVEEYISEQTGVTFTHGLCKECLAKYYGDFADDKP